MYARTDLTVAASGTEACAPPPIKGIRIDQG
jgi:hypothetical protein